MTVTVDDGRNGTASSSSGSSAPTTYSPNSSKLKYWRKVLGRVRDGGANAKVLVVGDSTVTGSGATGTTGYGAGGRPKNAINKLGAMMNSYFVPSRSESIIGSGGTSSYATFDPRLVPTSFNINSVLNTALGNAFQSNTNGAKLAFTPTRSFDRAQVWYAQSATQGTFTIDVDGGAALATVNASGSNALMSSTVSTTLGTHTLNINKTNTSSNYILGIRVWDSTLPEVEIIQAGWSGAVAANFIATTNAWDSLNMISNISPDLTIIDITINDAVAATSLSTYTSQLQTLITAAKVSGDVMLATGVPSAISQQTLAIQQTYIDAVSALATTNSVVFIDQWRRWQSYEISNPVGFYTDTLHPNGLGYADYAMGIFEVLTSA